jgi:hypothetical protein
MILVGGVGIEPTLSRVKGRAALNLQVLCRCFSPVRDFLVFDNLPFIEAAETGPLDSRDMDKYISSAALSC